MFGKNNEQQTYLRVLGFFQKLSEQDISFFQEFKHYIKIFITAVKENFIFSQSSILVGAHV